MPDPSTALRHHPAVDDAVPAGGTLRVRGAAAAGPLDQATARRAHRAGLAALAEADVTRLPAHVAVLDRAAHAAMAATLTQHGLFTAAGSRHPTEQVYAALRVAGRHRRLVRRWLRELARVGLLAADGPDFRALRRSGDDLDARLAEVGAAAVGLGHGERMGEFLARCARHLPELLRDEVSVQQLMFPDGRTDTADSTYRDNLISRYVNAVAATVLREAAACRAPAEPLRVLEIGAGVGGTSAVVIPALAGARVDYHFTDVSPFFLAVGRRMFGDRPWVHYGLCDINGDLEAQGYRPAGVDVILAANVLHNARNLPRLLTALHELLTPGGWLVVIDTSREHPQIMTSTEFLMSPPANDPDAGFTDERRDTDQIFPTVSQWHTAIAAAGLDPVACLPDPDHPLATLGQHVHLARARLRPHAAHLRRYLQAWTGEHAAASTAIVVGTRPL